MWPETGKDDLLNATSLSNRNGWLSNCGTSVFVFMVYALRASKGVGGGGDGSKGEEWVVGQIASEHQRKKGESAKRSPFLLRQWAANWNGD